MSDAQKEISARNFDLNFYVGTDGEAMFRAERALAYSIARNTQSSCYLEWMDETRPSERWQGWNNKGWYTKFSNFRWAVPECSNFKGRAVYMDVDQIVLKDPKELFELEIPDDKAWLSLDKSRTDVIVFDCEKFKDLEDWPSIEQMKQSSDNIGHYIQRVSHLWSPLPQKWCCNDGGVVSEQNNKFETDPYDPETTCLLHYTQMDWQPWKPYPEKFDYPPHPHARAESIWWQNYALSLEQELMNRQ